MKKLFSLFAAILFAGSMMAAVEEFSVTITKADFNKTSYAANNNEKTSVATATADPTKTLNVKWTSNQMMLKSDQSCVQSQKTNGALYNAESWGTIKSITIVEGSNLAYTIGTSAQPTTSATGGFFQVKNNSTGTGYFTSITIVFEADASSPVLSAADVNLNEVVVDGNEFQTEVSVTVEAANLESDIAYSTNSSKIAFQNLTDLPAAGGELILLITANADDELNEEVYLASGDVKDTLLVTGKIFAKLRNPGDAAEYVVSDADTSYTTTKISDVIYTFTVYGEPAVKVGTSSKKGTMGIKVPATAKKLYFFAAAWANKACKIGLAAPAGVTLTSDAINEGKLQLTADAGFSGDPTVIGNDANYNTAKGDWSLYQFVIDLSGLTDETVINLSSTVGSSARFLVWDATYTTDSATAIENSEVAEKATKVVENGQLFIIENGVKYNAQGAVVK